MSDLATFGKLTVDTFYDGWDWYLNWFLVSYLKSVENKPKNSFYRSRRFGKICGGIIFAAALLVLPFITVPVTVAVCAWRAFVTKGSPLSMKDRRKLSDISARTLSMGENKYISLMSEFKSLSNFSEVLEWDRRAETELKRLVAGLQKIIDIVEDSLHKLTDRQREIYIARYGEEIAVLANHLQEAIDFTPNSPDEQKKLIKELRDHKKKLRLQKQEVSLNAKKIRRQAQTESIHAGKFLGMYHAKAAAKQRRSIRYGKQAALSPYEDLKEAIDRQILQLDKDILRVEQITT